MKKIINMLIILIITISFSLAIVTALTSKPVSIDEKQKLKTYADINLKKSLKYSDMEILRTERHEGFVVIYFISDGKEQRWFKPTKSFDKLIK